MKPYCEYCGQPETFYDTGRFNRKTGEKILSTKCTNPNCLEGKQRECSRTGHKFNLLGMGTVCKKCGFELDGRA